MGIVVTRRSVVRARVVQRLLRHLLVACGLIPLMVLAPVASAKDTWSGVEKVVAVGDLHGDYGQYIRVLKSNDLIDEKLRWAGGKVHFVQVGDVPDRGPDSLKIIRHLMKLEKQAKKKGGMVHALIGNHEVMNISADLRYVHPGEYSVLVTRSSKKAQQSYVARVFGMMLEAQPELGDQPELREKTEATLNKRYPLGYVEHRMLWEPGQELARWVATHNTVIKVNDTLYVHGGINPHIKLQSLGSINKAIKKELGSYDPTIFATSPEGPLWYRGLANNSEEIELEPLIAMLHFYGAKRIVIAHTPTAGAILSRFGGRVLMIDVGISKAYGGGLANLVIENDRDYVRHRGKLMELPEPFELEPYLKTVIELEPPNSRLVKYLKSMQNPSSVESVQAPANLEEPGSGQ